MGLASAVGDQAAATLRARVDSPHARRGCWLSPISGSRVPFYTATGRYIAAFAVLVLAVLMLAWVVVATRARFAELLAVAAPAAGFGRRRADVSLIPAAITWSDCSLGCSTDDPCRTCLAATVVVPGAVDAAGGRSPPVVDAAAHRPAETRDRWR